MRRAQAQRMQAGATEQSNPWGGGGMVPGAQTNVGRGAQGEEGGIGERPLEGRARAVRMAQRDCESPAEGRLPRQTRRHKSKALHATGHWTCRAGAAVLRVAGAALLTSDRKSVV